MFIVSMVLAYEVVPCNSSEIDHQVDSACVKQDDTVFCLGVNSSDKVDTAGHGCHLLDSCLFTLTVEKFDDDHFKWKMSHLTNKDINGSVTLTMSNSVKPLEGRHINISIFYEWIETQSGSALKQPSFCVRVHGSKGCLSSDSENLFESK